MPRPWRRGQDDVDFVEKCVDSGATGLAQFAGRDPGRIIDLRSGLELVPFQAFTQQAGERPRFVGMGARTVEGRQGLLTLGHVPHRRGQFYFLHLGACLCKGCAASFHALVPSGESSSAMMSERDRDPRRSLDLRDRQIGDRHQRGAEQAMSSTLRA